MLNRMWSDRRERNLRQVKTDKPVPEGANCRMTFALVEDDIIT